VHSAAVLLHHAKQQLGDRISVTWRYFSLEQVNSTQGPEWKLWDQPDTYPSRARLAWKGAEAARRRGTEAFERFHLALLTARHQEGKDLTRRETILGAARAAGLDLAQFERDLDHATLAALGRDHEEGVERYGVFGTPTLVFANGRAAYLKLRPLPPEDELLAVWERLADIIGDRGYIIEIKRPVPPAR
jgi:predicted DsbA family dithiol-disulfide isomerase